MQSLKFNHVVISYANLLEQKKVLNGQNVHLPHAQEWFGTGKNMKMAVVSLFWDTKGAFDWEIWIQILKFGFKIYNRTRNPKTDFNAEIGFSFLPFDWKIRKRI